MRLVIANRNYSSWSLRPWLALRQAGIPFEEQSISFNAPDFKLQVERISGAGQVPVLIDDELVVWDSLAIVEYLAERWPARHLWPTDSSARAHARAICSEMHAGLAALRAALPMNCSARFPTPLLPREARRDITRVFELWEACRTRFGRGGPFLYGDFSIADAYFAPVTRRCVTYGIALPPPARTYVETLASLPAMQEWLAAAAEENDFVARLEPYRERP
jgi:glutathione S-transferase